MSQNVEIIKRLMKGPLTRFGAFKDKKINTLCLNSRIPEIKKMGYEIKREFVKVGKKRVAEYTLVKLSKNHKKIVK